MIARDMKKIFAVAIMLLMAWSGVKGQEGYRIKINISGYQFNTLIMTSYYGDKVVLMDTAEASNNGEFIFEKATPLPQGIYMAVSPEKSKLFEYIVGEDQYFSLSTDTANYVKDMVTEGSEENELFYQFLKLSERLFALNQDYVSRLKRMEEGTKEYDTFRGKIDSINKITGDFKLEIIDSYPGLLVSAVFNATREVIVPEDITDGTDSVAAYRYFKQHFWDYLDLSDNRMLRTPMLARKIDQYFRQLVL